MYFYLIVALQGFCIYHLYKNRNDNYWFFIIILLPVIGSIIYIITQVFNTKDVDALQNEITTIIHPTKKVKDLHRKLEFSDTYQNRVDLADAYYKLKDYGNAILFYQKALEDEVQDNAYVIQQLISSYHSIEDYSSVISYASKLKDRSGFKGSKEQFYYGLALDVMGSTLEAETQLMQIDKPYSNYNERLELAKFYLKNDKKNKAVALLNEIHIESQHMTPANKRLYRTTISEVRRLLKTN